MIDRLYTTLQTISNKDVRGNLTPEEFNLLLNLVIEEKYEEYFFDLNRALNRQNRGLGGNGLNSIPEKLREKLDHYYTKGTSAKVANLYPKPADARYIDLIMIGDYVLDKTHNARSFHVIKTHNLTGASDTKPVSLEYDDAFEVFPDTVIDDATVYYLRNPLRAKWTYDSVTGLYNPSATDHQDVDMHASEEQDILRRMVGKIGVNLKDPELAQYGIAEETREFNEESAV